jgi:hypothetical protein
MLLKRDLRQAATGLLRAKILEHADEFRYNNTVIRNHRFPLFFLIGGRRQVLVAKNVIIIDFKPLEPAGQMFRNKQRSNDFAFVPYLGFSRNLDTTGYSRAGEAGSPDFSNFPGAHQDWQ